MEPIEFGGDMIDFVSTMQHGLIYLLNLRRIFSLIAQAIGLAEAIAI